MPCVWWRVVPTISVAITRGIGKETNNGGYSGLLCLTWKQYTSCSTMDRSLKNMVLSFKKKSEIEWDLSKISLTLNCKNTPKSISTILYQTCSVNAYCGEWECLRTIRNGGRKSSKTKQKGVALQRQLCATNWDLPRALQLHPRSRATDDCLLKEDPHTHNFSCIYFLKFIGANGEERQKQETKHN